MAVLISLTITRARDRGMTLGGDDDDAREMRLTRSAAIGLGNAHDVYTTHLLCGPQHVHDYPQLPSTVDAGAPQ